MKSILKGAVSSVVRTLEDRERDAGSPREKHEVGSPHEQATRGELQSPVCEDEISADIW